MTTPNGSPTGGNTARHLGFDAGDAATQAAAGEAHVRGSNQDMSTSGAAEVRQPQATQKSNIANTPGTKAFTDEV